MKTLAPFVPVLLALAGQAIGQDQATTLLAAAKAAHVVVVARVDAATDPSPDWHRLEFTVLQTLKGQPPEQFAVLEPAGACCGRSLFALQVGERRLLFLQRRGLAWHPFGGARGVVPAEPTVVAHTAALLAANSDAALAHLLATNLQNVEPRIADDAAQALAVLPSLTLDATDRAAVADALQDAVQRGTVRTAPLVDAAVRVADAALLDRFVPTYLTAPRADQARLLRQGLLRTDAALLVARLPQFVGDDQGALRAAELLVEMPAAEARSTLDGLLTRSPHPRVALCIAEGLLTAGADTRDLQSRLPAQVLELAQARANRPKRFRAIDPTRR
jgi:hypothetical protein